MCHRITCFRRKHVHANSILVFGTPLAMFVTIVTQNSTLHWSRAEAGDSSVTKQRVRHFGEFVSSGIVIPAMVSAAAVD
jgi:hypothetical protein